MIKSSLDHCGSVVVVLGWHTRPPECQGSKRSLLWPEIPAVSGGWVVFFLVHVPCWRVLSCYRGRPFGCLFDNVCCILICSIAEFVISSHQVFVSNEHVSTYHCSFNEGVFRYRSNPVIQTVNPCYEASLDAVLEAVVSCIPKCSSYSKGLW